MMGSFNSVQFWFDVDTFEVDDAAELIVGMIAMSFIFECRNLSNSAYPITLPDFCSVT